jgi:hypothetical protein
MDNKKKILLLAVLGGAGYFAYKKFFKKQEEVEDKPTPSDVGKPQTKDEIKDSPMRAGGTPVSLPPVPLISPTPNSHTLPATPYVAPVQVSPRVTPSSNYGANVSTSLPTWTTLSPTSNFSNSARPLNVTATGGNATNYYATMNGVRSRRKRKPKYCI